MAQAFLTKIDQRQTKVGIMYDLLFSNGDKIGAGKFLPKGATEGEYYQYEYSMNGNFKNLTSGSLSKLDKPAGVTPPAPRPTGGSSGNFDERQDIISKQAALNSALSFVSLLVAADALPVAKTIKTDKKTDAIASIVNEYTTRFYHQATGKTFVIPEAAPSLTDEEGGDVDWQAE